MRRITFALFKLYATAVVAGIGSVFGWCLGWWLVAVGAPSRLAWPIWILSMLLLMFVFGFAAYKNAPALRGEAPTNLTWITPEEFAGP